MLVKAFGGAVFGIDALVITVEVNTAPGAKFYMVGLPDNAVKESQQRVEAALRNNGFKVPGQRITVNLAPADIRKEGSSYDLPIAIGILAASEQIRPSFLDKYLILGELSLDGSIQPIRGALPVAFRARAEGFEGLIVPEVNAREAAVVQEIKVYGIRTLRQAIEILEGHSRLSPVQVAPEELLNHAPSEGEPDFADVRGQENIKRALEIAAAGGHNVILVGPPGAGKTMLARRLPGILPPLTLEEAIETTMIHSVAGKLSPSETLITRRPFRSPHHTISDVALVGGGSFPRPGEISLAHNGVLFLDELPEFKRQVLEVLRQPMEDRVVTISRSRFTVEFPASFMLVASMNPCPCGNFNHPEKECTCPPGTVAKYLNRISGPLLDRIDLHVEVTPVPFNRLSEGRAPESSATIRQRVVRARQRQAERFRSIPNVFCNAQMNTRLLREVCRIPPEAQNLLRQAMERLGLSARAYDRILKVARTVADLDNSPEILTHHVAEAIQYRTLDRELWRR
ncbi:MAG: YifB family Mg chelatase-like AAA ATPase [Flavobacteriales bacterium]|nr:YifB family Mg chelatase-like AAA ATPase [Flavobacteriales bacterium]MCX7767937.1 YifB family Mg chelatase-like AAA ATPase [Flavobacteriales bacterium]MDW8409341.1 YifB family Mg chelatase-like AAA ATPase [Flavobacteriales bacterium]